MVIKFTAAFLLVMTLGSTFASACARPEDRAADGSRCGGRAASERPGGK